MSKKLKKDKTPGWYRKKCVVQAKDDAKERDKGICQHCGKLIQNPLDAHGSHILPEGAYPLMSAEVDNIILLCYRCHINWWHKHPLEASEWFNLKWPGRYKELQEMAQEKLKHVVNWKSKYDALPKENS